MDTNMRARTVTAQRAHAFRRMKCLPERFGAQGVIVEHRIYNMMAVMCREYMGGFWEFYELSNDGFYMAPQHPALFTVQVDGNGYEGRMSADAAGIVACAMTYSHMSFADEGEPFARAYYQLRDYLMEHPEHAEILRALD